MSLTGVMDRPRWQRRAACRGIPIKVFFPERGETFETAAALCADCPVKRECLAHALADPTLDGYWAGTSARDRRRMRRVAG